MTCGRGAHPPRVATALSDAEPASRLVRYRRRAFDGTFVSLSRMTPRDEAVTARDDNIADLIAVGRPAIANPDLVTRWQSGVARMRSTRPPTTRSSRTALRMPGPRATSSRGAFSLCDGPLALHDRARAEHSLLDELEVGLITDAIEQPW